jgi:hypothetical protein
MNNDIFSKYNIAKLTFQEAVIQLCFTIIGLCFLVPAIGWWGVFGLWIVMAVNNNEQFKRTTQYADNKEAMNQLRNLISLASSIPNPKEGEGLWNAKDKTSKEEEPTDDND